MLKKNYFKSYLDVLPSLKDLIQEDIMVSLTDKSKFIAYYPGDKMKIDLKAGTPIPEGDPLRKTISSNSIISSVVPKEVYGLPFKSVTYPVKNNKGECIGAVGFAKSLEKEFVISTSLESLIQQITEANDNMHNTSQKIANISNRTHDISSATEEAFASIQEVTTNSQVVDEIAERAKELSSNVRQDATKGRDSIYNVVEVVKTISESSKKTVRQIKELNDSINKIENMVYLITQLSEQTNLLALNASIEAARAGDHGRGFAVVANEVGNLAEQSKSATVEIAETVKSIQDEIKGVMKSVDNADLKVSKGVSVAEKADENISSILDNITKVDSIISDVSQKSKQQLEISLQISSAIESLANSAEDTASNTQSISSTVEEQMNVLKNFESEIKDASHKITSI